MSLITDFVTLILTTNPDYEPLDRTYLTNQIRAITGVSKTDFEQTTTTLEEQLDALVELSIEQQHLDDTVTTRDQLRSQLANFLTPKPSTVNRHFWRNYALSPQTATDYFYQLCCLTDQIKLAAIAKNTQFQVPTPYGDLDITINLSKPEKDPKAIAAAAQHSTAERYPACALCFENEGYRGDLGQAARSNHRIVRLTLGGNVWGLQYSPYAYFNEHAIFIDHQHEPMVINQTTFTNLLDLVTLFPDYFVGSNADLPIVGGSMLSHEHYQGGRHVFPMDRAPLQQAIKLSDFPTLKAGWVKWPMSVLRLTGSSKQELSQAAEKIRSIWAHYSHDSQNIVAFTGSTPHHTLTPIAHYDASTREYRLDLVLRDNHTTTAYPDGVFHPHADVQHIKKENIGLIEVMGLAILPGRLQRELAAIKRGLLGQPTTIASYHQAWYRHLQQQGGFTADNCDQRLQHELGLIFNRVLADAGVFKDTPTGQRGRQRFIDAINGR